MGDRSPPAFSPEQRFLGRTPCCSYAWTDESQVCVARILRCVARRVARLSELKLSALGCGARGHLSGRPAAWPGEECRWHREGRACRTQPPFAPRRRPRQGRAPKTLLRLDDVGCARSPVAGRRAHRARVARDLRSPGAVGGHGRGCRLSARRGLVDLVAVTAGFGHDRSGHDRGLQVVVEP